MMMMLMMKLRALALCFSSLWTAWRKGTLD